MTKLLSLSQGEYGIIRFLFHKEEYKTIYNHIIINVSLNRNYSYVKAEYCAKWISYTCRGYNWASKDDYLVITDDWVIVCKTEDNAKELMTLFIGKSD